MSFLVVLTLAVAAAAPHHAAASTEPPSGDEPASTLSEGGAAFAAGVDWEARPHYGLTARVEPETGEVGGVLFARLPVGAAAESVTMRWFPGVVADHARVTDVAVDDSSVTPTIEDSIITVPLPAGHPESVNLVIGFGFTADEFAPAPVDPLASAGDSLDPAEIGLLAKTADAVMLGHWFPTWVPDGLDADPDLDGFGDISNYPAASISAAIDVPEGTTVVTSGVRLDERPGEAGRTIVTEGATGLRDLAIVVLPHAEQVEVAASDTTVVVSGPAGTADMQIVADQAATSVTTLSDAFGAYPWDELDVVAAPLGSGVGGMEWPGMVWIESTVFAGGVPGLGDLGIDPDQLDELLGDSGLGDLFGIGDMGLMIETMREWTIAHEVGHMWWHALVGNDSNTAPVVDEALAQHSACLVERVLRPAQADEVCDVNTSGQFEQLSLLMGVVDGPADQATDEFASSTQYGALVYGKAPLFYRRLEERYGVAATTSALAAVVEEHAFDQVTSDQLRDSLGAALGDPAGVTELWTRWIEEAHAAEDLPA